MKLILTDKADTQHDLDDIILEFAGLHASAGLTFQSVLKRLEVIEAQLGIELEEVEPAVIDADIEPTDANQE